MLLLARHTRYHNSMRERLSWLAAAMVAGGVFVACGGIAVIESDGSGGASSSSASVNPLCSTPPPEGDLVECSSGVGAAPAGCVSSVCDEGGNVWQSDCEGNACRCKYNNFTQCTCVEPGNGDLCSLGSCCPEPFPK